jgi:hypothetical protein
MRKSKYTNRRFVWLKDVTLIDSYKEEYDFVMTYFSNQSFTYYEYMDVNNQLIRLRKNYRSKGGSDYANIESGHRFATLLDLGVIKELK